MRAKYVEELFPRWFIFGELDGRVDVADPNGDVFRGVQRDTADRLIEARDAFVDAMTAAFIADESLLSACCKR